MFKCILVAVDGSTTSNRALQSSVGLAKEQQATLHVLHVVDQSALAQASGMGAYFSADYVAGLLAALRDAGRKILVKAENVARKAEQPVRPALVEARGQSTARVILAHARKVHADLIVLGTHGRRGLTRLVMGSDAEAVLREATVPVLLLRSPKRRRVSRELTKRRRESAGEPLRRRSREHVVAT